MRATVLAALVAVAACSNDEHIIDAPVVPIDAPITDAGVDALDAAAGCAACTANQVCVAYHDGTCSSNIQIECQDRHNLCTGTTCTQAGGCEFWHCKRGMDAGSPYICYSCPNDVAGALNCHGP